MDDLISRKRLLDILRNIPDITGLGLEPVIATQTAIEFIEIAPAVDAVPVIRCANCKWWNGNTLGVAHRCAALHIATTGEFYCAAADRKSNAYADQSGAEYADNPTV